MEFGLRQKRLIGVGGKVIGLGLFLRPSQVGESILLVDDILDDFKFFVCDFEKTPLIVDEYLTRLKILDVFQLTPADRIFQLFDQFKFNLFYLGSLVDALRDFVNSLDLLAWGALIAQNNVIGLD